jgi:hypothetical protein
MKAYALMAVALVCFAMVLPLYAAGPNIPQVQLNAEKAGPREVEETTETAIARDYGKAWQSMAAALATDQPAAVSNYFVGFALDNLKDHIGDQQTSGLRTRYVDHGHKLEAVFYSQEGSAMELHDVAQYEIQLLDGGTVVHSDNVTARYIVLMTPTADHWQIRILQQVPNW